MGNVNILSIIFFASVLFVVATKGSAQFADVIPLTSTYEDVVRSHNGERQLPDGSSIFDSGDYTVTIKYYYGGCAEAEEKKLGLAPRKVIQRSGVPKRERTVIGLVDGYIDRFRPLKIAVDQIAYVDPKQGLIVTARVSDDKPEMVMAYYYVPRLKEIPPCLLRQLPKANRTGMIFDFLDM